MIDAERLRRGFMAHYDNKQNRTITIDAEVASYLHDLCLFHEMELLNQQDLVKSTVLSNAIAKELKCVQTVMEILTRD